MLLWTTDGLLKWKANVHSLKAILEIEQYDLYNYKYREFEKLKNLEELFIVLLNGFFRRYSIAVHVLFLAFTVYCHFNFLPIRLLEN